MTSALIVRGGFHVELDPASETVRATLIRGAEQVQEVTDPASQEIATAMLRDLNSYLKEVKALRVKLKAPILRAGEELDWLVKDHIAPLEPHALRLGRVLASFQLQEQARVLREERERSDAIALAQAEEKARQDEARAAAGSIQTEEDLAKAIQAEADAKAAVAQTDAIIRAPMPEVTRESGMSLRRKLDFELLDIHALYRFNPAFVRLEPNRAEILRVCTVHSVVPGLKFIEEAKVSVRT